MSRGEGEEGRKKLTVIEREGKKYIVLNILPEPLDDTDEWYDLFVKDYSLKDKAEPPSYNQEGRGGLEHNYPYIIRLVISGADLAALMPPDATTS